ncbi:MAG: PQQ-dependent sugar dehydrogenase [Melioribacteraceae bacterium]|nr:PQQ-dependent sugar dehydrogenase [Melioribacteraceae bacterium]MCF8353551.1 PQQ-dependent sugar dehydrogenase [Melioribacteraceae bacterium]MCF8392515.1 PQQ-dependent sugar dehydrogenase [Melioribacteraceae bacterium]MCF8418470.1 PQQ-dependent sugar dehydrogenase [Melioribacteraceae bacterium]
MLRKKSLHFFVSFLLLTGFTFSQLKIVSAFPNLSFENPVDIQHAGDNSNRIFIVEQEGRILVFNNDADTEEAVVFLDIQDQVLYGGEQGLLGLAFHPDYEENGYFYIDYTTDDPKRTVISRYSVSSSDPNSADPTSETVLLEVYQPYSNHNGGQLIFGPDGYLYVSFGDGGSGGDPQNYAQNLAYLLGKMIRIDVDNNSEGMKYSIPSDNPFANNSEGYREEIFAYGLRNAWRFSFDSGTDDLWAADVGQNKWEEINIIESGKNYGWRLMEGLHCYNPSSGCDTTGLVMPIHEYYHDSDGGYSITGGFVYRGNSVSELIGKYVYGDFVTGNIWALDYNRDGIENQKIFETSYSISTFGTDQFEELYFASFSNGKIYKFAGTPVSVNDDGELKYHLDQNYPNPFNSETTIVFSLEKSDSVKLEIFNSLGEHINTLINDNLKEGRHSVKWNAGNMSSGVYYYKLSTSGYTESRKMILMR